MVSHQRSPSEVTVRHARAVIGHETHSLDSVYQNCPLPAVPRLLQGGTGNQRHVGDSMLAYTERVREIKNRTEAAVGELGPRRSVLEVRARHIPKVKVSANAATQNLPPYKRRPLSLDELVGRPKISAVDTPRRRYSVSSGITSVPDRSPRPHEEKDKKIRISFVSASDLFDLVDFSLRSKRSRKESLSFAQAEENFKLKKEASYAPKADIILPRGTSEQKSRQEKLKEVITLMVEGCASPREYTNVPDSSHDGEARKLEFERNSAKSNDVEAQDVCDFAEDKQIIMSQPPKLTTRPRRAKRMRLHRSHLGAIPEDDQSLPEMNHSPHAQAVPSSKSRNVLPSASSLAAIKVSRSNAEVAEALPASKANRSGSEITGSTDFWHTKGHSDHLTMDIKSDLAGHSKEKVKLVHGYRLVHDNKSFKDTSTNALTPSHNYYKDTNTEKKKMEVSPRIWTKNGERKALNTQHVSTERSVAREKAQKKFRKLIFLRDYPDQFYQRLP